MIPRSALLRQRATIIRNPGARNAFGAWVASTPLEVEAQCVSSPDTGQVRELDGTGARIEGTRIFWFDESQDVQLAAAGHATDSIRYSGEVFRVVEIQRFARSHVRVLGLRVVPNG